MYLFFIGIILCGIGGYLIYKGRKLQTQTLKTIEEKFKDQIKSDISTTQKDLDNLKLEIKNIQAIKEKDIKQAAEIHETVQRAIEAETQRYEEKIKIEKQLARDKMASELEENLNQFNITFTFEKEKLENELLEIKEQLNEFKAKRDAINEQLRKEEQAKNEIDFHRIQLTDNDKEDIKYLTSIEPNIHNKELLHKLIWSEYIQKPFNQMIKNIIGNTTPKNVIYCIENIESKKKYIGKTTAEYKDRMTNHIKSSLGIGTLSRQLIHTALFGHWDEFIFYIIEEVKDSKLSDREKYYINFYQTDKYGYNTKVG